MCIPDAHTPRSAESPSHHPRPWWWGEISATCPLSQPHNTHRPSTLPLQTQIALSIALPLFSASQQPLPVPPASTAAHAAQWSPGPPNTPQLGAPPRPAPPPAPVRFTLPRHGRCHLEIGGACPPPRRCDWPERAPRPSPSRLTLGLTITKRGHRQPAVPSRMRRRCSASSEARACRRSQAAPSRHGLSSWR